ncbi:SLC13 family permease [Desulfosarcina sp.]|uniref:SLC13 family permease n=1 Tax=Desulfosarcina sp. TaxID=2027861 RepID=UPI0029B3B159|nr:SLC13 family permease [Desulfosarcina sp.]MDX2455756.1 SLC13 family permease [Desulfosarcina sp.]MDX2493225.1 SLC13 family permease [Desulfosarcina sp.]
MTPEIMTVMAILVAVIILLVTEWAPLEVLAMLVMGVLAITDIVSPKEALAGFSNPAVVTIWAVFILSGGLTRTGIANILGRQLLKVAGGGESTLVVIIMVIAGVLSAFMNNVAVAALMLPVVMDIARKTDRSPSTLLMPLAYGSLLGGLTTMIGTPPNILVSEALRENGLEPFKLFDFSPVGLIVMACGVAFVTLVGTRLLPKRNLAKETAGRRPDFRSQYRLQEHLFQIRVPGGSALVGKTLAKSRLGAALRLTVVGITRTNGITLLAPPISEVIQADDLLIVEGKLDQIQEMNHWGQLLAETDDIGQDALTVHGMQVARLGLKPGSAYEKQTIADIGFRNRFGLNVLAIERGDRHLDTDLKSRTLNAGDLFVVYGPSDKLAELTDDSHFQPPEVLTAEDMDNYAKLGHDLRQLRVPDASKLIGMTLSKSRLGDAVDVQILCIVRTDGSALIPTSNDRFEAGDRLMVWGTADMISILLMQGLEGMFIEADAQPTDPSMLEDDQVGLVEVILSPHSMLSGKTLHGINFREKYGLTVLAIWRKGTAYRENLRDMALEFGDALLLYGSWDKLNLLGHEPDFLVLTETAQEAPREEKAKVALTIMAAVLIPVIMDWVPIYIAVVIGAAFMVLTRCLTMEEAYRYIEWKAVFLIAGMLPLGTALDNTGAATILAEGVVGTLGPFGPYAVLFGLLVITFIGTSIIPTAALVVLMVPIALKTAASLGISPYALMMGIAMAASSSFTSPISHPANVLVMGPGGYRFIDYIKVGLPLTLVVLVVLMIVLPIFWPLMP